MHYPKVVSATKDDRSHTIAGLFLRAQNGEHSAPRPQCGRGGRGGEGRYRWPYVDLWVMYRCGRRAC